MEGDNEGLAIRLFARVTLFVLRTVFWVILSIHWVIRVLVLLLLLLTLLLLVLLMLWMLRVLLLVLLIVHLGTPSPVRLTSTGTISEDFCRSANRLWWSEIALRVDGMRSAAL